MTIKAYLVDDSAVMRQTLQHLLQGRDDIELIGAAPNPLLAAPALRKNRPEKPLTGVIVEVSVAALLGARAHESENMAKRVRERID